MEKRPAGYGHTCHSETASLVLGSIAQAPFAALLFRADDDLTLLWRNEAHATMSASIGRTVEGQPMFVAFPPSEDVEGSAAKQAIFDSVSRIRETQQPEDIGPYRFDLQDEQGEWVEHHWQIRMSPVVEDGEVTTILQVAQDVTNSVLSGRMSASLQRAAKSSAAVSYFSFDQGTGLFKRSGDIDAMFGFDAGEVGDDAGPFFARVHPDDLPGVHAEVDRVFSAPRGEVASFDYRVALPDGTEKFLRIRGEVATDPEDRRDKLVGTFVDLTDIEENRRALAKSLELREALVKEANHRIKNSIAIALGMLRIQRRPLEEASNIEPAEALNVLKSVENRIRAVSDVHGLMQLSEERTTVSFRALLDRLVKYMRTSAGVEEDEFVYSSPHTDAALDSDVAVSLGLILNEVITNALKYGLGEGEPSRITVTANVTPEDISVRVANDVVKETRIEDIPSTRLGSRLVDQLSSQLGAQLETRETQAQYVVSLTLPR